MISRILVNIPLRIEQYKEYSSEILPLVTQIPFELLLYILVKLINHELLEKTND